MAQENTELQGY